MQKFLNQKSWPCGMQGSELEATSMLLSTAAVTMNGTFLDHPTDSNGTVKQHHFMSKQPSGPVPVGAI